MLWVLKNTISLRWFFLAPKTNVKLDGQENIYKFMLGIFVNLNLCPPGHIAKLVTCLATDACLTADLGVVSLILARSHTLVEFDREIIFMAISPPF